MSIYDQLSATVVKLFDRYGQAITLTRATPGAYNVATGATAAGTTTQYVGTGVLFDYAQRDIDGTNVRIGDQLAYLAVDDLVAPATGDTVTVGAKTYNVVRGEQLNPAGTAVLYKAQLRGVS